jgi:hypothetical protein
MRNPKGKLIQKKSAIWCFQQTINQGDEWLSPETCKMRTYVVRGPVDGRYLVWWVIDNVVWTDSWLSIAGAGYGLLVLVQVKNKRGRSMPVGLQVWSRQVGLVRGIRWPVGSSAGRMVARTVLTVDFDSPSHEFTFNVGIDLIFDLMVLTPLI